MTGQWSFTMPLEIWVFQLAYSGRITSHTQEIQLSYPLSSFYSFLTVKRWGDSHGQEKEILSDLNPRLKKKLITELKSSSQRILLLVKSSYRSLEDLRNPPDFLAPRGPGSAETIPGILSFFFGFARGDIPPSNKWAYWTTLGYFNFKYISGEYYLLNTNLGKVSSHLTSFPNWKILPKPGYKLNLHVYALSRLKKKILFISLFLLKFST